MRAKTGSFETEYLASGSGPWLILSHCLGGSLAVFQRQMDALARHFHVLAYDLRGQGQSGNPGRDYSLDDTANDLMRLMDGLGIERASVVGLSMGGMVAQCLAIGHPDRVDKLVLADTSSHYEAAAVATWHERAALVEAQGMEALAGPTMERWFTAGFRQSSADEVAHIRSIFVATDPQGYALACRALARFDVRPLLPRIAAPTLVVAGEQDVSCPPAQAQELARQLERGRFELIPSAAHVSCVEQPERFNELVLEFLAGAA